MTVSVAIMAHPKRGRWVPDLVDALHVDDGAVVWDRHNDRYDTGLRCLRAFDPAATHHLIVQDDVVVCRDLVASVERAVAHSGEHPVGLFCGRAQPQRALIRRAVHAARQARTPWVASPHATLYGQALVLPTADLDELACWFEQSSVSNYDNRIAAWYRQRGVEWWVTVPSLVDHREETVNPSLVVEASGRPRRGAHRTAMMFIGENRSAVGLRWSAAPVRAPGPRVAARPV